MLQFQHHVIFFIKLWAREENKVLMVSLMLCSFPLYSFVRVCGYVWVRVWVFVWVLVCVFMGGGQEKKKMFMSLCYLTYTYTNRQISTHVCTYFTSVLYPNFHNTRSYTHNCKQTHVNKHTNKDNSFLFVSLNCFCLSFSSPQ